jgi:hypothetical protein
MLIRYFFLEHCAIKLRVTVGWVAAVGNPTTDTDITVIELHCHCTSEVVFSYVAVGLIASTQPTIAA